MAKRKNEKRYLIIVLIILLIILAAIAVLVITNPPAEEAMANRGVGLKVVIDPGHGGFDTGATGVSGVYESKINLDIATGLRALFESHGAEVVMTRTDENALGDSKDADMKKRREIISSSGQDVTVSIHQNHFEDPNVSGPQVFYAPGSEEGRALAEAVQESLNKELEPAKPRSAAEGSYYIVKSGAAPAIIVECGFISNPLEEALLRESQYKVLVAHAIAEGVYDYLEAKNGKTSGAYDESA